MKKAILKLKNLIINKREFILGWFSGMLFLELIASIGLGYFIFGFLVGMMFIILVVAMGKASSEDDRLGVYENAILIRDKELKEINEEHEALKEIYKKTKIRNESLERQTNNQAKKITDLLDTINKQDQSTIIKVARSN